MRTLSPLQALVAASVAVVGLTACEAKPRDKYVQWVARDAWNPACAELAMIEIWKADNLQWKEKGQSLTVDVDAKFKLSQNRSRSDQLGVIAALERGGEGDGARVAEQMRRNLHESEGD